MIVDVFSDGCGFRDFFKANYGPTIATYARIADEPDQELARLGDEGDRLGDIDGVGVPPRHRDSLLSRRGSTSSGYPWVW